MFLFRTIFDEIQQYHDHCPCGLSPWATVFQPRMVTPQEPLEEGCVYPLSGRFIFPTSVAL